MERLRRRLGFWVDILRVRQILTWFLTIVPIRICADGRKIRMRCWSDLLAFHEIFSAGIYDPVFDTRHVRTYCDLGCQSGFALLRLVQRSGAPSHAILVDGNPFAVDRCRENVVGARLEGVCVVHGAVGWKPACGESMVRFTLRPNELECSLGAAPQGDHAASTIDVPVVDLDRLWVQSIGDVPCDLLKMDIEGAERGVLLHSRDFLARVERCVLEWHGPRTEREAVTELLQQSGFRDFQVLCEGEVSGILQCRRIPHTQG